MKFKTVACDADRASGILFNVKPSGDWLAVRYNDTENNIGLWEFHNGMRRLVKFSSRDHKFMLDRSQWHQLTLTVDQASLKATIDGEAALDWTLGSEPAPAAITRRRTRTCSPPTTRCCDHRCRARLDSGPRRTARATSRSMWW